MKPELQRLYDYFIIDRTHRALRVPCEVDFATQFSLENLSDEERMCRRFEAVMAMETPRILPDEKIVMTRSVSTIGDVYTEKERKKCDEGYYFQAAYVNNICPSYEGMIRDGFEAYYENATPYQKRMMDAVTDLCDRYRALAKEQGCYEKYYNPKYQKKLIAVLCPEVLGNHYGRMATDMERVTLAAYIMT